MQFYACQTFFEPFCGIHVPETINKIKNIRIIVKSWLLIEFNCKKGFDS